MLFRILGPISVLDGDREVGLGGIKQRSLLGLLLVHRNETMSLDRLIDGLWGERPPDTAAKTVQVYVSRLRKALGEGRIETHTSGYVLVVADEETDAGRFAALCERARGEDAPTAAATLREALALVRGAPLADVLYEPWAAAEAARLDELQLAMAEELAERELAAGNHLQLLGELEARVRAHPLRERARAQLMLALYRSGRQAEALEAYREGRRRLDEELGLEPGPELRELEQRILRHDDALRAPRQPRPQPRARRRGLLLVLGGAALLAASAAAAAVIVSTRGGGSPLVAWANSVAALDPRTGAVVAVASVGDTPTEIVADGEAVWTLNSGDGSGTITRVDAVTKRVTGTFSVSGSPRSLALAGDVLWVGTAEGKVFAVDRASGVTDRALTLRHAGESTPFAFDPGQGWLTAGRGAVWATSLRTLTRISPGTYARRVTAARAWGRVAYGLGSLWISGDGTLLRVDPRTGVPAGEAKAPAGDHPFAAGAGAVWVPDDSSHVVVRVDPLQEAVVRTIELPGRPLGVTVGADAVWVAVDDGTVVRIDPATNATRSFRVGGRPRAVALGAGLVWVAVD